VDAGGIAARLGPAHDVAEHVAGARIGGVGPGRSFAPRWLLLVSVQ